MRTLSVLGILWGLCVPTFASAACVVLYNGPIVLEDGVFPAPGVVVFDDGIIHSVGKMKAGETSAISGPVSVVGEDQLSVVSGLTIDEKGETASVNSMQCRAVDVQGDWIAPGFIEVGSQMGLIEVELEPSTKNVEGSGDPIRAALQVVDGYNPLSSVLPVQRVAGVTSAILTPDGGLVSGQAAWVSLAGVTQADAVRQWTVGVRVNLTEGSSRADTILGLRELFQDAQQFWESPQTWEQSRSQPYAYGASRLDLQTLVAVLQQNLPLMVTVDRSADIEALIRLKREFGFDLLLMGGAEAWMHADRLASLDIPVVIDPLVYGAGSFDQLHGRAENGRILSDAGVLVGFSSFSAHNARTLRQLAGNAVRAGMSWKHAFRAISSNPGRMFPSLRKDSATGRIIKGGVADIVTWSGDPLEISSRATRVYIGGAATSLTTRQTELRDRYRNLPGTPSPSLPTVE